MKELLKYKILQYTETHKISVRKLERAAGFKENTINQILNGRSQNPSMETVVKISDAINCSLDEIFEREKFFKMTYTYDTNTDPEQQLILLRDTYTFVVDFIQENAICGKNSEHFTLNIAISYIEEIYKYSIGLPIKTLDTNFATWFLKQKFQL